MTAKGDLRHLHVARNEAVRVLVSPDARKLLRPRRPADLADEKGTDLCRKYEVSERTLYRWKAKPCGMDVSEARRFKQLEDENRRLKHMVSDLTLEAQAPRAVLFDLNSALLQSIDIDEPQNLKQLGDRMSVCHHRCMVLSRSGTSSLDERLTPFAALQFQDMFLQLPFAAATTPHLITRLCFTSYAEARRQRGSSATSVSRLHPRTYQHPANPFTAGGHECICRI
jgi:putative transposase